MATFQTRVEYLIDTIATPASLSDWLTAGARHVADLCSIDKLLTLAVTESAATSYSLSGKRFLTLHGVANYQFTEVDAEVFAKNAETGSIYKQATGYGVWARKGENIVASNNNNNCYLFAYPTVAYGDSSITKFPVEYEHGVVLFAALNALDLKIKTITFPTAPTISISADAPTPLTAPSFTAVVAADFNYTAIVGATALALAKTSGYYDVLSGASGYINSVEDIELAQAKIAEINTIISEWNTYSGEVLGRLKADKELTLSSAVQEAAAILAKEVQEYDAKVKRYSQEVQKYQADIQQGVQTYQADISKFQTNLENVKAQQERMIVLRDKLTGDWTTFLAINFNIGKQQASQ